MACRTQRLWLLMLATALVGASCSGDSGDSAESDDEAATTTTTTTPSTTAETQSTQPPDGPDEPFTDPGGTYTLTIGSDWIDSTSTDRPDIDAWTIKDGDEFGIVAIETSTVLEVNLDQYLHNRVSEGIGSLDDVVFIDTRKVQLPDGREVGVVEYTGTTKDGRTDLHLLGVVALNEAIASAVVATFTTTAEEFDHLRPLVEPHLLTLEVT